MVRAVRTALTAAQGASLSLPLPALLPPSRLPRGRGEGEHEHSFSLRFPFLPSSLLLLRCCGDCLSLRSWAAQVTGSSSRRLSEWGSVQLWETRRRCQCDAGATRSAVPSQSRAESQNRTRTCAIMTLMWMLARVKQQATQQRCCEQGSRCAKERVELPSTVQKQSNQGQTRRRCDGGCSAEVAVLRCVCYSVFLRTRLTSECC